MDFTPHVENAVALLANVTATWRLPSLAETDLDGLFTDPSEPIGLGDLGAMAAQPRLAVATADLPAGAANGDRVTINSVAYTADAMDAHSTAGITRMALVRV